MRNLRVRILCICGSIFLLHGVGCSSTQSVVKNDHVVLMQDSTITEGTRPAVQMSAGSVLSIKKEPLLIESPGHIGVLLHPHTARPQETRVSLKKIEDWDGEYLQNRSNRLVNSVVVEMSEVYSLLNAKRVTEALARVEELQKKYPKLSSLHFIRTSCLILLGKKSEARVALSEGLKDFPESQVGQRLYEIVYGRKRARTPAGGNR